jgi:peptide deformylase
MKRDIIQAPDVRLRAVAKNLDSNDAGSVVEDLRDTFAATGNCIGLAAPQLGHPWRAIIVDVTPKRLQTYLMVNPVIVKASEDLQLVRDGCMSVDGGRTKAATKRPKRIIVEWTDFDTGAAHRRKFSGLLAACIHHEVDHLEGLLFLNRLAVNPARELL